MDYCTPEDVRMHAPQAEVGFDLSPYVTQAGGVIDANIRSLYILPLAVVPQLLRDCAGQLAAGYYLTAHYTKVNQSTPKFASDLIEVGRQVLLDIRANPALLGLPIRDETPEDLTLNSISHGQPSANIFDSSDPLDWVAQ